ncbi:MAG: DHH family phosphoesterase [Anaerolineae bacterium]
MAVKSKEGVLAVRPVVRPRGAWERATQQMSAFLDAQPAWAHHVLLCHNDADGLAAGVLFYRALQRTGRGHVTLQTTGKGQSAWSTASLRQIAAAHPQVLVVLDLGSRPQPLFPGVPTLLIDHHRPMGKPDAATLISSYSWLPNPCSAALVYWLVGEMADVRDSDWIAAIGIVGDMGEHATIEPLPEARKRYGNRVIKETTTLVNAARRSASGDASLALHALLNASAPADIARGRLPEARALQAEREAFNAALTAAKRAAPTFASNLALIRVRSPYQVHPVLAQIWRGRLPNHIVMVLNEGYLPDRASFSLRTALDVNLLDFLEPFRSSLDATELGYGHDKATGGSLPREELKRFLATLGFAGYTAGKDS